MTISPAFSLTIPHHLCYSEISIINVTQIHTIISTSKPLFMLILQTKMFSSLFFFNRRCPFFKDQLNFHLFTAFSNVSNLWWNFSFHPNTTAIKPWLWTIEYCSLISQVTGFLKKIFQLNYNIPKGRNYVSNLLTVPIVFIQQILISRTKNVYILKKSISIRLCSI